MHMVAATLAALLTVATAAAASQPPRVVPSIGSRSLLDTTIRDGAGSCSIALVKPALSDVVYLHLHLSGCGTRSVTRRTAKLLDRAIGKHACSSITCVVTMTESNGASILALPVVVRFLLAHRQRMTRVSVLEAQGLALNAVRTVIRLKRSDDINIFHTWDDFERVCATSSDERDRQALQLELAQRARRRALRQQGGAHATWARLAEALERPLTQLQMGRASRGAAPAAAG